MAVGLPLKTTYADGDVYSASDVNDTNGTINLLQTSTLSRAAGKNAIINGGMDIWQRGTSISYNNEAKYSADRWQGIMAQQGTISRQATADTTNLPSIQYCARIQRNSGQTGVSAIAFDNNFESTNSIPMAGRAVTISLYARAGANFSAASSALTVQVVSGTGTDQVIGTYTGLAVPVSGTATLTTTWQRFTFTGTIAATATELAIRTTYTPVGTAGANDYFEVTGVQLELGSYATTFSRAGGTIQGELAACQRYYWSNAIGSGIYALGFASSTTGSRYLINFPVSMRVPPTSITYNAGLHASDLTTYNYVFTALTMNNPTLVGTRLDGTVASGQTAFRPQAILGTAGAPADFIAFSAEL
jgi:hypothetical protein